MMRSATFRSGWPAVALLLTGRADRHTNRPRRNTTQLPSFSRGLEGDEDGADDYADADGTQTKTVASRSRRN